MSIDKDHNEQLYFLHRSKLLVSFFRRERGIVKVLVTGGAGYIGSHTVRALRASGHNVVVIDTLERGHRQALLGAPLFQGDIANRAYLDRIFREERPEAVIHFAAYKAPGESMTEPTKYFENNVHGMLILLDVMTQHHVDSIIFSSSCSIFGAPAHLPVTEDMPYQPESVYGETKLIGERLLKWFDVTRGLKSISLRYFNAAGASLDNVIGEDWTTTTNLIPLVMKAAVGKAPAIKIFGTDYPTRDGTAIRDYIHVVDLATAHVKALEHLVSTHSSTAYNLGRGIGYTVQEVIDTARRVSGVDFRVERVERRPGDPVAVWADNSKAERELGWQADYDLETMLRTAWNWHSTHPNGFV
jgi:UDP-glucose 4-epimerase